MGSDEAKVVAAVNFGTRGTGFAWTVRTPLNDDPLTSPAGPVLHPVPQQSAQRRRT